MDCIIGVWLGELGNSSMASGSSDQAITVALPSYNSAIGILFFSATSWEGDHF